MFKILSFKSARFHIYQNLRRFLQKFSTRLRGNVDFGLQYRRFRPIASFSLDILTLVFYPAILLHYAIKSASDGRGKRTSPDVGLLKIPNKGIDRKSILYFGPIDWSFRHQRPQQISREFSDRGWRTFYVNPTVHFTNDSKCWISTELKGDVEVWTIFWNKPTQYIGVSALDESSGLLLAELIEDLLYWKACFSNTLIFGQPGWYEVASRLCGNQILFDCMDRHEAFADIDKDILTLEKQFILLADQTITSSTSLEEYLLREYSNTSVVVRNAADFNHFSSIDLQNVAPAIAGYFGAVAEWFDAELIVEVAKINPSIQFEIIGSVTNKKVLSALSLHSNIILIGEVLYSELPKYVGRWTVGLLPFLINDLTLATNPVKMYEYASAGLPIISTALPEVLLAQKQTNGIFIAENAKEFNYFLHEVLNNRGKHKVHLQKWGAKNSWSQRIQDFENVINNIPKISIIVLMWNNSALTIKCLASVIDNSDYPNLEIIVVDNDSLLSESKVVQSWLEKHVHNPVTFDFIRNSQNFGFASGNNIGLKKATGDFLVLLNNDTEVTVGWLWRSLKHFKKPRSMPLGILGPSTDNCGNEARIVLKDGGVRWRREVLARFGHRKLTSFRNPTVAFFCVMMSRQVYSEIGGLDEDYGRGYFEDDDYCRRVAAAGYEIVIARDVFVHHEMGASFNKLPSEEQKQQFEKNKLIYESRWGKWTPHSYSTDNDQYP